MRSPESLGPGPAWQPFSLRAPRWSTFRKLSVRRSPRKLSPSYLILSMLRLPRPLVQLSLSQLGRSRVPISGPSALGLSLAFPSRAPSLRPFSSTRSILSPLPPSPSAQATPNGVVGAVSGTQNTSEKRMYPVPDWADRLPARLKWTHPYMSLARMDKPIGTWLLFWPCGQFNLSSACGGPSVAWLTGLIELGQLGRSRWQPTRPRSRQQCWHGTWPCSGRARWSCAGQVVLSTTCGT